MTQFELAEILSKTTRTIQAWEKGDSYPPADMVWRCAEIFDTDPNDVVGWYDTHERPTGGLMISEDENNLISDFRALTQDRKAAILTTASDSAEASLRAER